MSNQQNIDEIIDERNALREAVGRLTDRVEELTQHFDWQREKADAAPKPEQATLLVYKSLADRRVFTAHCYHPQNVIDPEFWRPFARVTVTDGEGL